MCLTADGCSVVHHGGLLCLSIPPTKYTAPSLRGETVNVARRQVLTVGGEVALLTLNTLHAPSRLHHPFLDNILCGVP